MTNAWWKEKYIDTRAWILDNVRQLNLEADEALILLLIETANMHQEDINLNQLALRSNMQIKDVDAILTKLVRKGYLNIEIADNRVHYDLSGLFTSKQVDISAETSDIVEVYEREFKRPLSTHEIEKLNDWLMKVDYAYLIHALREAIIYHKMNFSYIDRILMQWVNDKVTLEQLNAGERNAQK